MPTEKPDVDLELISGPPYRTVLRLALPTVIAMLQSCQSSFKACIQQCPPATATTTTTTP